MTFPFLARTQGKGTQNRDVLMEEISRNFRMRWGSGKNNEGWVTATEDPGYSGVPAAGLEVDMEEAASGKGGTNGQLTRVS